MRLLAQVGLVALGSGLGGLARWGVTLAAARWLGVAFPYGTFVINVSGCLFLGWFHTALTERWLHAEHHWVRPEDLRLLLAVGFAGAYTTFSTFEMESSYLLRDGDGLKAAAYVAGSVFLGLLAVRAGAWLAHNLT